MGKCLSIAVKVNGNGGSNGGSLVLIVALFVRDKVVEIVQVTVVLVVKGIAVALSVIVVKSSIGSTCNGRICDNSKGGTAVLLMLL
jgi:hypothetical protein